jgi:hypothetical protein
MTKMIYHIHAHKIIKEIALSRLKLQVLGKKRPIRIKILKTILTPLYLFCRLSSGKMRKRTQDQ